MGNLNWKLTIPWSMVAFRTVLEPVVVLAAWQMARPEVWLGAMIGAAFVSDVFDGILARRWGTASAHLRVADTTADTIFYLSILAAIIIRHGSVLRERSRLLIVVLILEVLRIVFDLIKFHKMASYHTYTAKFWGILLAAATIALLCFNRAFWLLTLALLWGVLCDLEGLTMSIVLPEWTHDVKSLRRAFKLRSEIMARR